MAFPRRAREIAEKQKGAAAQTPSKKAADDADAYAGSTDEDEPAPPKLASAEDDDGSDSGLPDLPEFFSDKRFFLYGDFPAGQQRLLTRYIAAYNG